MTWRDYLTPQEREIVAALDAQVAAGRQACAQRRPLIHRAWNRLYRDQERPPAGQNLARKRREQEART